VSQLPDLARARIVIEQIMFFSGGFLVASLLALTMISAVHNRAVRLTTRRLEDAALDGTELQVNMDCVRAQFAMDTRRLENRNEDLRATAAVQLREISRKTQMIDRLKAELARRAFDADDLGASKDLGSSKTPTPQRHRGHIAELEATLAERGLFLNQCDAQIDTLFYEIADKKRSRPFKSGPKALEEAKRALGEAYERAGRIGRAS
jgi:hypothetical protein